MAAATGDSRLRARVDYIVAQMADCQAARLEGGLYANKDEANGWFAHLGAGTLDMRDVVPWYVMHKTLAGLRDAWMLCGNVQARDTLIKLATFCVNVTAKLTDAQWTQMTSKEFGAPDEELADVYALTHDEKFLEVARRFSKHDEIEHLAHGDDSVYYGKHANTRLPLYVGYERIYEVGGDSIWHTCAQNFWNAVLARQTFAFGGNSIWEAFINPAEFDKKLLDTCGPETCNTYNLLKLTQQLYALEPALRYVDYMERALYNQILPSENTGPEGGFAYYTPTRSGHHKVYSRPFDAMWCCVGTGMENQARYGGFIYAAAPQRLYVNLFIPSVLQWHAQDTTVRQLTAFPNLDSSLLEFTLAQPRAFTVSIRCPAWCAPGAMRVEVNGQPVPGIIRPDTYFDLARTWQNGDQVRVILPLRVTTEFTPGAGNFASFFYGPILLAAPLGREGLTDADFFAGGAVPFEQLGRKSMDQNLVPKVSGSRDALAAGVQRDSQIPGLAFHLPDKTPLVPFYEIGLQRYSVYFPYDKAADAITLR